MSHLRYLLLPAALVAALLLGVGAGSSQPRKNKTPDDPDLKLLQSSGIGADAKSLLDFFAQRTLKDDARKELDGFIQKLDAGSFRERKEAQEELLKRGEVALPLLKKALKAGPLELVRRVEELIRSIERGPGSELPAAAARVLVSAKTPPARTAAVLLDFLPFVEDEWLEEEVLRSIGALWLRTGRDDRTLADALKDKRPEWRGPAAYVLGQRGGLEWRAAVRHLLEDPDPSVRLRAAEGLIGKHTQAAEPAADEATLRAAGIAFDGAGLLQYLKDRSLDEPAIEEVKGLTRQLGDRSWSLRERATARLITLGQPAVPFLKLAAEQDVLEVAQRATRCLEKIRSTANPALPTAAVRLLTRAGDPAAPRPDETLTPTRAIAALLAYVPFAADEAVEDEIYDSLCVLSARAAQVDPQLLSALGDPLPLRRGAAAYALGRSGTREDCAGLTPLLNDPVHKVRYRAALGLLSAGNRAAVPALIDLLSKAPDSWVGRVEEALQRVAADRLPEIPPSANLGEYRKKAAVAWRDWWQKHESTADLSLGNTGERRRGLFTVVEYDSNNAANRQGKIWEFGRDGNTRWQVTNVQGPMDAQVLANGRILIAESNGSRVTERDLQGNILWQFNVPNPVYVQRLPNGNTFIAAYFQLQEVTPAKQVVWSQNLGQNFLVFDARRMRNGHIVYVTSQGTVTELDAQRQVVRTVNVNNQGNWCGVEPLPNGRYLVAASNLNSVREIDGNGRVLWEAKYPGAFRATRLANGNTLVASMTSRQIAEIDRSGNRVWEKTCQGRPWRITAR